MDKILFFTLHSFLLFMLRWNICEKLKRFHSSCHTDLISLSFYIWLHLKWQQEVWAVVILFDSIHKLIDFEFACWVLFVHSNVWWDHGKTRFVWERKYSPQTNSNSIGDFESVVHSGADQQFHQKSWAHFLSSIKSHEMRKMWFGEWTKTPSEPNTEQWNRIFRFSVWLISTLSTYRDQRLRYGEEWLRVPSPP